MEITRTAPSYQQPPINAAHERSSTEPRLNSLIDLFPTIKDDKNFATNVHSLLRSIQDDCGHTLRWIEGGSERQAEAIVIQERSPALFWNSDSFIYLDFDEPLHRCYRIKLSENGGSFTQYQTMKYTLNIMRERYSTDLVSLDDEGKHLLLWGKAFSFSSCKSQLPYIPPAWLTAMTHHKEAMREALALCCKKGHSINELPLGKIPHPGELHDGIYLQQTVVDIPQVILYTLFLTSCQQQITTKVPIREMDRTETIGLTLHKAIQQLILDYFNNPSNRKARSSKAERQRNLSLAERSWLRTLFPMELREVAAGNAGQSSIQLIEATARSSHQKSGYYISDILDQLVIVEWNEAAEEIQRYRFDYFSPTFKATVERYEVIQKISSRLRSNYPERPFIANERCTVIRFDGKEFSPLHIEAVVPRYIEREKLFTHLRSLYPDEPFSLDAHDYDHIRIHDFKVPLTFDFASFIARSQKVKLLLQRLRKRYPQMEFSPSLHCDEIFYDKRKILPVDSIEITLYLRGVTLDEREFPHFPTPLDPTSYKRLLHHCGAMIPDSDLALRSKFGDLTTMVDKIEGRKGHPVVPENPIERESYYQNLSTLLSLSVERIEAMNHEELQAKKEEIRSILEEIILGAKACGTRWQEVAEQSYGRLYEDGITPKEQIASLIDEMGMMTVQTMIHSWSRQPTNVHIQALFKAVAAQNGLHFRGSLRYKEISIIKEWEYAMIRMNPLELTQRIVDRFKQESTPIQIAKHLSKRLKEGFQRKEPKLIALFPHLRDLLRDRFYRELLAKGEERELCKLYGSGFEGKEALDELLAEADLVHYDETDRWIDEISPLGIATLLLEEWKLYKLEDHSKPSAEA